MTGPLDALASGGESILGRPLSDTELQTFDKYLALLLKWQRSQRLIGSSDPRWIIDNVFLDSLLFLKVLPPGLASLVDVGSGAGVPGIPIKIVRPHWRLALVESRAKRASFLAAAVRELGLSDTAVVTSRVEDYAGERPHSFEAVAMRCAGDFRGIALAAAPLLTPGGLVVASGPPESRPLELGEWIQIPATYRGGMRRFALYRAR